MSDYRYSAYGGGQHHDPNISASRCNTIFRKGVHRAIRYRQARSCRCGIPQGSRDQKEEEMTPAHIELMIDRICGLFPSSNIARNTVKNAWTKDEFLLLGVDVDDIKPVLAKLENDTSFPSLARLKHVIRSIKNKDLVAGPSCSTCKGTGWDDGARWEEQSKDNWVMTQDYYKSTDLLTGLERNYVKKCECQLVS